MVRAQQKTKMTDPAACLDVFISHWQQALNIMSKPSTNNVHQPSKSQDNTEAVLNYTDQMMMLLVEEKPAENGCHGPILDYVLREDLFMTLMTWSSNFSKQSDMIWLRNLKMYEMLASQGIQNLLVHKPVIQPMLLLLSKSSNRPCEKLRLHAILLLHQLALNLSKVPELLELLFNASADHGHARFLMFSLLIPYVHYQGVIGQHARDALLLIMALSAQQAHVGNYIASNSDFCPVLATGLSGLYSSLPQKLSITGDDWYCITDEDIAAMPELTMFLNSFEFCNAVVQVAHPLVRDQLLTFIHDGFLVPVLAPALHQDLIKVPSSLMDSYIGLQQALNVSSTEEIIASTAYLELFIRRTTEPSMIKTFMAFLMTECHDDTVILDSLISRINSMSRLCMVSLSLFTTLVNLNCEDVMFQLVFRYLIPCSHVMVSQRRSVRDVDLYGRSAQKFLSLTPICCQQESVTSDSTAGGGGTSSDRTNNTEESCFFPVYDSQRYIVYLYAAHKCISLCASACLRWSAVYDGEQPQPDCLHKTVEPSKAPTVEREIEAASRTTPVDARRCDGEVAESVNGNVPQDETVSSGNAADSNSADNFSNDTDKGSTVDTIITVKTKNELKCEDVNADADSVVAAKCETASDGNCESNRDVNNENDTSEHISVDVNLKVDASSKQATPAAMTDTSAEFKKFLSELNDLKMARVEGQACSDSDAVDSKRLAVEATSSVMASNSSSKTHRKLEDYDELDDDVGCSSGSTAAPHPIERQTSNAMGDKPIARQISALSKLENIGSNPNLAAYPVDSPNIGPFLIALLQKLDTFMQNTLYVNLLLTGLITRLSCYPQPLLKSFLLNHNLVFQPTVKSLFQVLGSVKHKIDNYSYTVSNFELLLGRARTYLRWRDLQYFGDQQAHLLESPDTKKQKRSSVIDIIKDKRRSSTLLSDLFRRNSQNSKNSPSPQANKNKLQNMKQGYKYFNKNTSSPTNSAINLDQIESVKTKNVVYAALVLEEFLKELAAISQEHSLWHNAACGS